jgi:5'(3')-deoxyribonucleotidase
VRLFSDLFVVSAYTYVLLAVDRLIGSAPDATLFMVGFVGIFVGYWWSGVLRRLTYGKLASSLLPITVFMALYVVALSLYQVADREAWVDHPGLEWVAVATALLLMVTYRVVRRRLRARRSTTKRQGLVIGIDVDGVLANQIAGVLPRIKRRLGIDLAYEDVTHWALPLGDTNIAVEIAAAMEDPTYVMDMPVHADAKQVLDQLHRQHTIRVITARPAVAAEPTKAWLTKNALEVDDVSSAREKEKSLYATDLLVDDYLGNILEFLTSTNGIAVLVDQPWNRDRAELAEYIENGRLEVISGMGELPAVVERASNGLRAG